MAIVKRNAKLVVFDCQCLECGEAKLCYVRNHLIQLKTDSWRCDECWDLIQRRNAQELLEQHLEKKRLEEERKQDALKRIGDYRRIQLSELKPISALCEVDKLLLAATIESLGAENLRTTVSLRSNFSLALSPSSKLDQEILHHLFKSNLLLLRAEESYEYVTFNSETGIEVDYYQATFEFAYTTEDLSQVLVAAKSKKDNINMLVSNAKFEHWCRQIQLEECLTYLRGRAELNNLAPPIGDKLVSILRACLVECSVSVMQYIIYKATESAAARTQKPQITRKHASNSILGNIERIFDKISNGSWQPYKSYRESIYPQSAIAKMFFDYVFKIDDGGFHQTVDELFNPYKLERTINKQCYSALGSIKTATLSITIHGINTK